MQQTHSSNFQSPKLLKAAVYGANDGIVTTFAVVAGVTGADLAASVILVMGVANMVADGLAMGLGDYLGESSQREMEVANGVSVDVTPVWLTGAVTFVAFVCAGALPLLPYFLFAIGAPIPQSKAFHLSIFCTAVTLFVVGSLRTHFSKTPWWRGGLQMLGVGAIASGAAYLFGHVIEQMVTNT